MRAGRRYLVTLRNIFYLYISDSFLKSYKQKLRKFSNFSVIFLHQILHISQITPPIPLIFLSKMLHCICHILAVELEFFENYSKLFKNKKFKCLQHSPCNVLDRQTMLYESNLYCCTCGMKEVLLRQNTMYIKYFNKNNSHANLVGAIDVPS